MEWVRNGNAVVSPGYDLCSTPNRREIIDVDSELQHT